MLPKYVGWRGVYLCGYVCFFCTSLFFLAYRSLNKLHIIICWTLCPMLLMGKVLKVLSKCVFHVGGL
jgi:hypothetical protein